MNKSQLRQLIREEIKKSVNEGKDFKKDKYGNHLEPQFKKGDKVTYLGNKGVITNVNKEMGGAYSYDVSYDKGSGKTKASNIYNKDGKTIQLESVNEDLGTIALGVMGGIGLYKILKFALKKVGVAVGSRVPLPKESLHNIINETNKALINNFIKGDKTLNMMQIALLTKVLKDYVDDGTIKNAKDIQAYAERAMKAMVKNDSSLNEDQEFLRARDEIENDKNKAKKLASLMAPGDDMLQQAAQFGPYEVLQVGADAIGSGSEDMYAYDGVFTQYDFMLMFKKAGYSNEAIEILMDDDYVQRLERG